MLCSFGEEAQVSPMCPLPSGCSQAPLSFSHYHQYDCHTSDLRKPNDPLCHLTSNEIVPEGSCRPFPPLVTEKMSSTPNELVKATSSIPSQMDGKGKRAEAEGGRGRSEWAAARGRVIGWAGKGQAD